MNISRNGEISWCRTHLWDIVDRWYQRVCVRSTERRQPDEKTDIIEMFDSNSEWYVSSHSVSASTECCQIDHVIHTGQRTIEQILSCHQSFLDNEHHLIHKNMLTSIEIRQEFNRSSELILQRVRSNVTWHMSPVISPDTWCYAGPWIFPGDFHSIDFCWEIVWKGYHWRRGREVMDLTENSMRCRGNRGSGRTYRVEVQWERSDWEG